MADTIRLKRSAAAGAVPAADQLQLGELAVNVADGRIYLKKLDGTVVATAMKVEFDAHVGSGGGAHALATPSAAGFMPAADKAKLNGVQAGATANDTDANLRNRATHTGTQTLATISDAGTAAARNVQSSPTDTTPDRLMVVGAGGILGTGPQVTDLNADIPTGIYGVANSGVLNAPTALFTASTLYQRVYDNNITTQILVQRGDGDVFTRVKSSGSWQSWRRVFDSGNQLTLGTTSASARAALEVVQGAVIQPAFADFNAGPYTVTGQYTLPALANNQFTNAPATSSLLSRAYLRVYTTGGYTTQELLLTLSATGQVFTRAFTGSTWLPWSESWSTSNFNPANYSTTAQMQAAIVAATTGSPVLTVSTTTRTLALSDWANGAPYALFTSTAASTLTVPANSSVAIPIGAEFHISREANANLTIVGASGVLVKPQSGGTLVMTENMRTTLKKVGTNTWHLIGQTVAA